MTNHKPNPPSNKSSESGFTIIESLVAIIVVTVLMIGLAPIIVLSVATRVQARRVEVGTQAARDYMDGVRGEAIDTPNYTVQQTFNSQRATFAGTDAPSNTLPSCTTPTKGYCKNDTTASLYCVDLDGGGCTSDSTKDVIVQAFRSVYQTGNPPTLITDPNKGYLLGIRVYRADGFSSEGGNLKTMAANQAKSSTVAGGTGDKKAPLVEMITEIPPKRGTNGPTDANKTYDDFCERVGGCN